MNSKLLKCHVTHTRLLPKKYQFKFNYFWLSLDLDELEHNANKLKFFSLNKFNLFSFHEKDYLPHLREDDSLRQRVENFIQANGVYEKVVQIKLITSVRVLGYVFNPVSFYFIKTEKCEYSIIEIGNTFNEIKPYFVGYSCFNDDTIEYMCKKEFYISPFSSVKNHMKFFINKKEDIKVRIEDYKSNNELELITTMHGSSFALSDKELIKNFFKYPLMTLQVIFFIHYHALRLYLRKIPFYKKSMEINQQKGYQKWKI